MRYRKTSHGGHGDRSLIVQFMKEPKRNCYIYYRGWTDARAEIGQFQLSIHDNTDTTNDLTATNHILLEYLREEDLLQLRDAITAALMRTAPAPDTLINLSKEVLANGKALYDAAKTGDSIAWSGYQDWLKEVS